MFAIPNSAATLQFRARSVIVKPAFQARTTGHATQRGATGLVAIAKERHPLLFYQGRQGRPDAQAPCSQDCRPENGLGGVLAALGKRLKALWRELERVAGIEVSSQLLDFTAHL